jgi:uncharacterized protein YdaU (DUF1376 family)
MTLEQRGAYHEMLCASWQMGPLPADISDLSRLLGTDNETMKRVWREPLISCWKQTAGGLINERLEAERGWAEIRQIKAKKAAKERWEREHMRAHDASNASGSHSEPELDPDPDLDIDPEEEKKAVASQTAPLVFWHPKPTWKKDHPSLEQAILRIELGLLQNLKASYRRIDVDAEIAKIENHARANPSWAKNKKDWRRTLTKWLNRADERFEDERFKAGQARASPKEPKMYETLRRLSKEGGQQIGDG